ncbi:SDR family NAD(P)-dependent oxidoreductase [Ornithinimicrobium cavernae]|uniref:SDR family NAD(P)-dependent oxidoreductase n=1 Tax=Ornithinimicrobium cavernae TaxID=2666047 RepID=UPI00137B293C|nr:SDR family oxidoreductase [Ornithinimicrobium cavernae]
MSRTAVVIGAGQGMGRAVAERLAARGAHVHLVGRTEAKLQEVADAITASGGTATVTTADLTRPDALEGLLAVLDGPVDVLVHTVGESLMKSISETTFEDWQRMLSVNLTSAYVGVHALLPRLRQSENATIVLVSSKTALKGYPVVAYSAAKAGVLGFARALASELAPESIRVVPLCPGPTDTPMRWSSTPDMDPALVMSSDAIADTVEYVVGLPRGTVTDTLLVQAAQYD